MIKDSQKGVIDKLFSYTPKDLKPRTKSNTTRDQIIQNNFDIFLKELNGAQRLSSLITSNLISNGSFKIENNSILETINFAKNFVDILISASKKIFQPSETSQLLESVSDIFLHLVYTYIAAFKTANLEINIPLIDNKVIVFLLYHF